MATYRVKAGDNLWDIGEKLFGDGRAMKRIMYLNNMKSTTIRPGEVLKLPTIVKGRNDRFRITNADIEQNRKRGGEGYGLATTGEIAAGNLGGSGYGGGDVKKPPVKETLAEKGINYQQTGGKPTADRPRVGAMTSLQSQYAGQYVKPGGITGGFVDSNKDAPFRTPAGVSPSPQAPAFQPKPPSGSALQYIPPAYQPAMTSNTNAPFRTPAGTSPTGAVQAKPTPQQQTAALGQGILDVLSAITGVPSTIKETFREVVDATQDVFNPPEATGSFSGIADAPEWLAMREPPPEVAQTGLIGDNVSGTFSDASIRAWKDFDNAHTQNGYRYYMDYLDTQFDVKIPIPADVVHKGFSGFGYTPEDMRLQGYMLDPETDYYVPVDPGQGTQGAGAGDGGFASGAGGGGFGGGGGGGGGGFGGGGGGGQVGSYINRQQNENAAYAIFKGVGSWKGANFG